MKSLILAILTINLVACSNKKNNEAPIEPKIVYINTHQVYVTSINSYSLYSFYKVQLADNDVEYQQNIDYIWSDIKIRQPSLNSCLLGNEISNVYPNYNLDYNVKNNMNNLNSNVSITTFINSGSLFGIINIKQQNGLFELSVFQLYCN